MDINEKWAYGSVWRRGVYCDTPITQFHVEREPDVLACVLYEALEGRESLLELTEEGDGPELTRLSSSLGEDHPEGALVLVGRDHHNANVWVQVIRPRIQEGRQSLLEEMSRGGKPHAPAA